MKFMKKAFTILISLMLMVVTITTVSAEDSPIDITTETEINGYIYSYQVELEYDSVKWTGEALKPTVTVTQTKTKVETEEVEDEDDIEDLVSDEEMDIEEDESGTITLVENQDYTLTYSNNVKPGTAKVEITGINNYIGTIEKTFKITKHTITINLTKNSTNNSTKKSTGKFNFKAVTGAKKYTLKLTDSNNKKIYSNSNAKAGTTYSFEKLTPGTKYTITVNAYDSQGTLIGSGTKTFSTPHVIGKVTLSSITAGNEMIKLNWKKVSGATGYEIYRSTSKTGTYKKVKTITSGSTLTYTNYLLSGAKTYYYKVRAYRVENGKTYYGSYSTIKYAKTKKATNKTYYLRVNSRTNVTTVYAKGFNNKYTAVKCFTTSCGINGYTNNILGTHYTIAKYKWKYMHEDCYTQYATRIVGHYLFHSIPYTRQENNSLWYKSYNKLGTHASQGCVRLRCIDAKWIYDHCPLKTKVIVTYSKTDPLKKQEIAKIDVTSKNRFWDPTDPNPNNPWKK